ncbi:hypothetical protein FU976_08060 [Campylobacter jejuni]|nr:hypothetical protein [Campylobacter jejuni]
MPLNKEKQGLELNEYKSTLPNTTYALRIGREVPEGDINLAYVHTPQVQSDENISLIDTSYTSDNVIPQDQLESMVVANQNGELEYVDLIGNGEVRPRPPESTFPSRKINVTRKFKKNEMATENALYYKFEIDYHYDSKTAIPDEAGRYSSEKYTGEQIEITDENGNLLDESYKYDVYVQAHPDNPRIYSVRIYLHKTTNKIETIKVRYNHIDAIVKNENIQSVQRSIEFYSNKDNVLTVDGIAKQMLEGGKIRILNGVSAFEERSQDEVEAAMISDNEKEIFAVIPKDDGSGYKIIVPQKSEQDPRVPRIFSHRVVAKYKDYTDQEVKVSVGHITDWTINPEALLKNEREDFSGSWKNIGMPAGGGKLNAKEMIELSLPFGTPSIPSDAQFYIEDDNGNILYNVTTLSDNVNVDTQVNEVMSKAVEAKANNLNQAPWKNAMLDNTVVKSNPIPHRATIIPERQKTKWDFTWKANGQGYTERTTTLHSSWKVCADVGFKKTIIPQTLDLLDKSKWATVGLSANIDKWQYSYENDLGKSAIQYMDNVSDIVGFYQRKEMIGGSLVDVSDKSDYQFSTKVRLDDTADDDGIGILFRVQNSQSYYMFIWEKDQLSTAAGTSARISLDQYGLNFPRYSPADGNNDFRYTTDKSHYLNNMGFGVNHKRMFKVEPSSLPDFNGDSYKEWNKTTRYPYDQTKSKFTEITNKSDTVFKSASGKKGWEYGNDYKITVVVTGTLFRVYINENVESPELGTLVCQGSDATYTKGSYGICTLSQEKTYWYDMNMTEIIMDTVCNERQNIVLTNTKKKKLSNYRAADLLDPLIKKKAAESYGGAPYENFGNYGESDGDFNITIDPIDGFIYGQTNNPLAGGVYRTPWTTEDNGLSVDGKGYVEYHSDGHFTIITDPAVLPTSQVPSGVLGFSWNQPSITSGSNVTIALNPPDNIKVTASVPPISVIGKPYTLSEDTILRTEGIKHLENLFGDEGFYDKLEIPENTPKDEILLRIERGKVLGISPNGTATTENAEYRVNYRFRSEINGFTRLPVDQFQDQLGVNRIRLKNILNTDGEFEPSLTIDVIAWTTFQDLEAVPLFAIKVEEQRKIEIEKPKLEFGNMEVDNWYLRIKNGRFLKRIILPYFEEGSLEKIPEIYVAYPMLRGMVTSETQVVEVDLEYNLPEYTNQEFHNRPYILMDKEQPVILNEYAIQTRHSPLVLKSETGRSFLQVYSHRSNQRRELRVSDVDAAKGIVYLHDRIREQDDIYVKYAYKEDWYTYRGFEKEDADGIPKDFFHLDLNPTTGHRHTVAYNGFHQWIPIDIDKETYSIPEEENSSTELLVKQIHVYLRPFCIRYVDPANPLKDGYVIEGTVRRRTLFHTDEEWWFNPKDYKYDMTLLRLGKVMLQANSNMIDNMTILDTRTRGGGLDESLTKEIIRQVNEESMYHWDIGFFDGEAYQENGVIVVRVPRSILKSETNPNGFHETEVQEAIAKHKTYGVLPIIEYYEPVTDENKYNMIPNPEFLNNQHIGYYDPVRSKGEYEVIRTPIGSGDDYVLMMKDTAEYGITIPGYKFEANQYRIDIKALKEQDAPARSAGTVEIFYKDGTTQQIQLSQLNSDQWMIYKEHIDIKANVHHVTITLNKTSEARTGSILCDYIMLHPSPNISNDTTEIHEI